LNQAAGARPVEPSNARSFASQTPDKGRVDPEAEPTKRRAPHAWGAELAAGQIAGQIAGQDAKEDAKEDANEDAGSSARRSQSA
jgi:hypothetical protein